MFNEQNYTSNIPQNIPQGGEALLSPCPNAPLIQNIPGNQNVSGGEQPRPSENLLIKLLDDNKEDPEFTQYKETILSVLLPKPLGAEWGLLSSKGNQQNPGPTNRPTQSRSQGSVDDLGNILRRLMLNNNEQIPAGQHNNDLIRNLVEDLLRKYSEIQYPTDSGNST